MLPSEGSAETFSGYAISRASNLPWCNPMCIRLFLTRPQPETSRQACSSGRSIKLLRLDEKSPEAINATKTYFPATIHSSSYPNWLSEDVPTLTVKAFLVTYNYSLPATQGFLDRFADSLCSNFDNLQAQGHPKWKQVKMELPALGKGWSYYPSMERQLRASMSRRIAAAKAVPPPKECSQQERVLDCVVRR